MIKAEDMVHMPTMVVLHKAAETLKHCTGAVNEIMQFADSYAMKASAIQNRVRAAELETLIAFTTSLRVRASLSSPDTRKVAIAWIESRERERVHRATVFRHMAQAAFSSVHVLLADTHVLSVLKGKLSPVPEPAAPPDEGKN